MSFVEKQSGYYLKVSWSDGGGRYFSNQFCKQHDIHHQSTVNYSPQQNDFAEKNMTIVEMVKSMLLEKGMSKKFWADAIAYTSYVLNICPTKSVPKKTP